jgi:hypothetical protein
MGAHTFKYMIRRRRYLKQDAWDSQKRWIQINFRSGAKCMYHSSPRLSLTFFLHLFRNSLGSSLHNLAASTFAGLSSLGLLNMDMTESSIDSGDCTGDHLSDADSYPVTPNQFQGHTVKTPRLHSPYLSSSGGCKMDMHTSPAG